ncbi:ribonuclease Y [bacterium]|nr:ribonuclease Y [bacterium]
MNIGILLAVALASVALTFVVFKFLLRWVNIENIPQEQIEKIAKQMLKKRFNEAEDELEVRRGKEDRRVKQLRKEAVRHEEILVEREKKINRRSQSLNDKSSELDSRERAVKDNSQRVEKTKVRLETELERISGLTREEAKKKLIEEIDEGIVNYEAKKIRQAEKMAEEVSEDKAQHILVESMQRVVTDYVGETTTSSIKVDDEKVKGRVIGKEGRNIRAFEKITGVEVIVDESPGSIVLSSFDPLRREIARVAMSNLIKDGRIHPGFIEETIRKAKNEISQEIKKNGQILAEEAGWPGIDVNLLKLIGKFKYRTSYGQSLMSHTVEVMRIGAVIAAEVGADVELVKRACLLHDVGKVLTHKVDSPHHHISGQIARKYLLDDKLVNAIEAHHLDIEPQSIEAVIVYLADAISGSRPGARKDNYEQYIQRIEGIEKAAKEIAGDKLADVFAIRAGRELRVIVKPALVSDDEMTVLAKDIATQIEQTQSYPGNVVVTVIRETRTTKVAK